MKGPLRLSFDGTAIEGQMVPAIRRAMPPAMPPTEIISESSLLKVMSLCRYLPLRSAMIAARTAVHC